jgi:hypothetical protein
MYRYLVFVAIVFAINLLPVFSPPTWALLVFYKLNSDINTVAILILGVLCASLGRYLLARATGMLRYRLNPESIANLESARRFLPGSGKGRFFYFLFFIVSPLPSAQVFEAAALVDAPLVPLTIAFMGGRSISYATTVIGASTLKEHAMGTIVLNSLKSPWGIALQLVCLLAIYLLMKIDWAHDVPVPD